MKEIIFILSLVAVAILAAKASARPQRRVLHIKDILRLIDDFSFVNAHRQGMGATVTWAFLSGRVAAFSIQRTYQDPNDPEATWDDVNILPYNATRSYRYIDRDLM